VEIAFALGILAGKGVGMSEMGDDALDAVQNRHDKLIYTIVLTPPVALV
jgi:hypothetical protein